MLIMLWDKALMRQKGLLELTTSWQITEAEETTAAVYWAAVTTQENNEGARQQRPIVTTTAAAAAVDSDTEATDDQSDKEGFVMPEGLHFDLNQGEPDMNGLLDCGRRIAGRYVLHAQKEANQALVRGGQHVQRTKGVFALPIKAFEQ